MMEQTEKMLSPSELSGKASRLYVELNTMKLVVITGLLATSICFAQASGDFKPATSNVLDAQYPQVDRT